jgi:CRP-like cAMP-binding protein
VAIARALANDPPLLVADEPTGNLDSKTASAVFRLFETLVDAGKTVVMVTHDNDLARRVSRAVIVADGEIVDEYVAHALATLTVDELTWVTQELEARNYAPGATIITAGEAADRFYIITAGEVEVLLHHPDGGEIVVTRMHTGDYFGEIGLLRGGTRTASVRAALEMPVQVASLDRGGFERLIAASAATRAALDRMAVERIADDEVQRQHEARRN